MDERNRSQEQVKRAAWTSEGPRAEVLTAPRGKMVPVPLFSDDDALLLGEQRDAACVDANVPLMSFHVSWYCVYKYTPR